MSYVRKKKSIFATSVWVMLTIFFTLTTAFFGVGSSIAVDNAAPINKTLGINPYVKVQTGQGMGEKAERFSSDYIERNADGTPIYETDAQGNKSTIKENSSMRKNSQAVSEQVAVEGTVLLWNKSEALPFATTEKISLFGIASAEGKYAVSGYGSGEVHATPTYNSLANALKQKGFDVNDKLDQRYAYFTDENVKKGNFSYGLHAGRWVGTYPDGTNKNYRPVYCVNEVPWNEIKSVATETLPTYNNAVFVVSRRAGEDQDILDNVENGETDVNGGMNHLELSKDEAEVLKELAALKRTGVVKKIVVLLNTANPLQFAEITKDEYAIDACLWSGIGGTEALTAVADALSNTGYIVSGHAPDALLMNNHLTPADANFEDFTWTNPNVKEKLKDLPYLDNEYQFYYQAHNLKYMVYQESIYVGYRYFETRYEDYVMNRFSADGANGAFDGNKWNYKNEVAFSFGYGLSYTEFEREKPTFKEEGDKYVVTMKIKNAGSKYSGKDVLQVYLNKPYTDYDKANGVEKAGVELVGFAKTGELKVGADGETVTVTVDKESFRTYDSYGAKTYILEKGDYYLSVGTSAHDALNNVLAAKGYTPANTDGRMDAAGDADMTYKITIAEDDFETYSKNEKGVEITNRFDEADLNLYEGTTDQKIKYVTRSDWNGTYPTEGVKLKCESDRMVYDMQYGHEVAVKDGDKMPVYGTVTSSQGALNIAMLEGLGYDDPLWEDLLNQMTQEEQIYMMNYGMAYLAGAESVGAPGVKATDGPQGVYPTKYAFPSPVLSAASFDVDLVQKLGDAYAHEAMHIGYTMVYAPGGNIHRTLYSGRNFEYYSEDGFLSGKMLSAQVKGMVNKGIIVCSKHFAFNDQETNRGGLATFFNEQSAREIYLRVFEYGVREGKMNGLMSAFNRIGCTWTGRHKGLLTDILRNEWGFIGVVETDACAGVSMTPHMEYKYALAEGLIAGNDVWMSRGSKTLLDDFKNNATVMLALREACHRVLYTQLHSAAINGITVNTKMIQVTPWWESLLNFITVTSAVVAALALVMAVASVLLNGKLYPKTLAKLEKQPANDTVSDGNVKASSAAQACEKGSPIGSQKGAGGGSDKKFTLTQKTLNAIVAGALALVFVVSTAVSATVFFSPDPALKASGAGGGEIHLCTHHCPVCGKCNDYECEDPVCADKCKCTDITIEAESEYVEKTGGVGGNLYTGVDEERNITYVGGFDGNKGAKTVFKFLSDKAGRTLMKATIRRRPWNFDLQQFVDIYVNGEKIDYEHRLVGTSEDTWTDDGTEGKGDFDTFNVKNFEIQEGLNEITFEITEKSGGQCPHFDKIELISTSVISEYRHTCVSKCAVCGKCKNLECDDDIVCKEKCDCKSVTVEAESEFAERKKADGSALNVATENDVTFVKDLNGNAKASVTFKVSSDKEAKAAIGATMRMMPWVFSLNQYVDIEVNGEKVEYKANLKKDENAEHDTPAKCDFADAELAVVNFKEGVNVIKLIVKDGSYPQCPDIDKITITSPAEVKECTHRCENVCALCGKCLDKTCTDIVCKEKCSCKVSVIEAEADSVDRKKADGSALNVATENDITFVKDLNGNAKASVTFKFNSDKECEVLLKATLRAMPWDFPLHQYVGIEVNGVMLDYNKMLPKDNNAEHDTPAKCDFVSVDIATIALNKGSNTIKFVVKEASYPQCPDFDKIELFGNATISEYSHKCESVCPVCGKCTNKACEDDIACKEKCDCTVKTIEAESDDVTITQAETPATWGGVVKGSNEYGGYVKAENGNAGSKITFKVTAEKAGKALLRVYIAPKSDNYYFHNEYTVKINGVEYTFESKMVEKDKELSDNQWLARNYVCVVIGEVDLSLGENSVEFSQKGYAGTIMDKIDFIIAA